MPRDIRERIAERLADIGKKPAGASKAGGLGPDAIRDLTRHPGNSPTLETVEKLAKGLQTTPAWLAFEIGSKAPGGATSTLIDATDAFDMARVDGGVKAGAFLTKAAFDDDLGEMISAPRDPDYGWARQIAYRVEGDSMNEAKPKPIDSGDFIICVVWEDLGLEEPDDGMIVVVERTKADGGLRERSVKAVKRYEDRTEFMPMSSNPAHDTIVVPRDPDPATTDSVSILALVRYVFDNQVIR